MEGIVLLLLPSLCSSCVPAGGGGEHTLKFAFASLHRGGGQLKVECYFKGKSTLIASLHIRRPTEK